MMQDTVGTPSLSMRSCERAIQPPCPCCSATTPGIGARRVHESDDGKAVPVGELHHAHRFAVALRVRHAEVPMGALADVAAFLVPDERDGLALETAHTGHERRVVRERAVAVELDEVVEDPLDVVERVRAILVSRQLDRAPDLVGARLLGDPVDLVLEPGHLPGDADPAEERQLPEPRQPVAQPELLDRAFGALSRHARRGRGRGPGRAAARAAGRSRPRGRSGRSTRRGRSLRAASRSSSAAPRGAR